jgi:hypothetical protein
MPRHIKINLNQKMAIMSVICVDFLFLLQHIKFTIIFIADQTINTRAKSILITKIQPISFPALNLPAADCLPPEAASKVPALPRPNSGMLTYTFS